jgi:hypothetical protein
MTQPIVYSSQDVCEMLEKAAALGLPLEKGSELEEMTIEELQSLVDQVGRA